MKKGTASRLQRAGRGCRLCIQADTIVGRGAYQRTRLARKSQLRPPPVRSPHHQNSCCWLEQLLWAYLQLSVLNSSVRPSLSVCLCLSIYVFVCFSVSFMPALPRKSRRIGLKHDSLVCACEGEQERQVLPWIRSVPLSSLGCLLCNAEVLDTF